LAQAILAQACLAEGLLIKVALLAHKVFPQGILFGTVPPSLAMQPLMPEMSAVPQGEYAVAAAGTITETNEIEAQSLMQHEAVPRRFRWPSLLAVSVLLAVVATLSFALFKGYSQNQAGTLTAAVALQARGGEYEVSDADIQAFYDETTSGGGGDPPRGTIVSELIVKFFYGEFTPQGSSATLDFGRARPQAPSARRISRLALKA